LDMWFFGKKINTKAYGQTYRQTGGPRHTDMLIVIFRTRTWREVKTKGNNCTVDDSRTDLDP